MRAHVRGDAFGAIVVAQDKVAQQDGQQWEKDRRAYQAKTRGLLDAQRAEQEQVRAAEREARRAEAHALVELQKQVSVWRVAQKGRLCGPFVTGAGSPDREWLARMPASYVWGAG